MQTTNRVGRFFHLVERITFLACLLIPGHAAAQSAFAAVGAGPVLSSGVDDSHDRGLEIGLGAGLPLRDGLMLVGRSSIARMKYGQIVGTYQVWQIDVGLRATLSPGERVRPFLGAAASAQSGRRDRDRRTPIPDHLGLGARLAAGVELPVSTHFGLVGAAEAGGIWMVAGRVEDGSWVRAEPGVRTDSVRLRVEVAWHP